MEEASPNLPGLAELKPFAATGAPRIADLALRLQAIAEREAGSPAPVNANQTSGVWAGLRSRIAGLVKVRDLGKARWADGLTEAARHLVRGDIEQAIAIVQAIEGPPPNDVKAWLDAARARAAIERAASLLGDAVRSQTDSSP
jgi:hypothetical protein